MTLRLPIHLAIALVGSLFVAGAYAQQSPPPPPQAAEAPPAPPPQQPETSAAQPPPISAPPPPAALPPPPAPAPYYQSPNQAPYYGPSPYARPRLSRGMLITGLSILGGSYTFAALLGAEFADDSECSDCEDIAPYLFIPLIGPFLASAEVDSGSGILAFMGVVQLVGAGLTVGGAIRLKRSKELARQQGFMVWEDSSKRRVFVDPFTSTRAAGLNLRLSL